MVNEMPGSQLPPIYKLHSKTFCNLLFADLEWKLIYVGSPESEKHDQVLDSVLVGPVAPGSYRFVFQVKLDMG